MKTAVLCVHGIQGSPGQFDWIIAALPAEVRVENVLLPGHGGDVRQFSKATLAQWRACVREKLNWLRKDYDRIVYIGHSMGCLLGVDAWLEKKEKIVSMILLACPLKVRITGRYIRQNLIAVSGRESNDPFVLAARSAHSVTARHIWEYVYCVRPYIDLFRLIASVNRRLQAVDVPMLAVFSERDEIVSRKSMDRIGKLHCCETHLAGSCGHLYYTEEARFQIIAKAKRYV